MRPDDVEVPPPGLDQHLGLGEAEEQLAVQQSIAQLGIEALAVTVLPQAAGLDVGGLGADRGDPLPHGRGDELPPVVGAHKGRRAAQDHQIGHGLQHVGGVDLTLHQDRQGLPGEPVDDT